MTDLSRPPRSADKIFTDSLAAISTGAPIPPIADFFGVPAARLEEIAAAWGLPALAAFAREGLLSDLIAHPDPRRLQDTAHRSGGRAFAAHRETRARLVYLEREARNGAAPAIVADLDFLRDQSTPLPAAAGAGAAGVAAK